MLQRLVARRLTHHRSFVDLPVAGVEDFSGARLDQKAVALRDRVSERNVGQLERTDVEARVAGNNVELHLAGQPFLLKLLRNQSGGEGRRVKRRLQVSGKIRNGTDMILMPVGEDDTGKLVALRFDELEIGQDQVDTRI